jgi:hypothetical protein
MELIKTTNFLDCFKRFLNLDNYTQAMPFPTQNKEGLVVEQTLWTINHLMEERDNSICKYFFEETGLLFCVVEILEKQNIKDGLVEKASWISSSIIKVMVESDQRLQFQQIWVDYIKKNYFEIMKREKMYFDCLWIINYITDQNEGFASNLSEDGCIFTMAIKPINNFSNDSNYHNTNDFVPACF